MYICIKGFLSTTDDTMPLQASLIDHSSGEGSAHLWG